MSLRDQAAQVPPPGGVLGEERQVKGGGSSSHGQLGADDRAHAERLARLRELHRPPDAVVVGQGEGRIAQLAPPRRASSSGAEAPSRKE